ncbi:MAG: hypothetical protein AAFW68_04160 [Pseudomonadota bacterium]
MASGAFRFAIAFFAMVFSASCGKERNQFTILDAAAVYESDRAVFASIRTVYPGPYQDFTRIPNRNPEEETRFDRDFFRQLRDQIPVEFIDFFPIGSTGADEINVVLKRYQHGDTWNTVSLIYFGMELTLSDEHGDMRMFKDCDEKALAWVETPPRAAFCRLNSNWYAFQRVE